MPITPAMAAGAMAGAAQDAGLNDPDELRRALLAATLVQAERAAPPQGGQRQEPSAAYAPAPHAHRPTQPPGPGLLNRLARWLNLK